MINLNNYRLGFGKIGLGPNILGPLRYVLFYNKLFHIAARYHDIGYTRGGVSCNKQLVDKMFLRLMLSVSSNKLQKVFSYVYYYFVVVFGFMFFNYNKQVTFSCI